MPLFNGSTIVKRNQGNKKGINNSIISFLITNLNAEPMSCRSFVPKLKDKMQFSLLFLFFTTIMVSTFGSSARPYYYFRYVRYASGVRHLCLWPSFFFCYNIGARSVCFISQFQFLESNGWVLNGRKKTTAGVVILFVFSLLTIYYYFPLYFFFLLTAAVTFGTNKVYWKKSLGMSIGIYKDQRKYFIKFYYFSKRGWWEFSVMPKTHMGNKLNLISRFEKEKMFAADCV